MYLILQSVGIADGQLFARAIAATLSINVKCLDDDFVFRLIPDDRRYETTEVMTDVMMNTQDAATFQQAVEPILHGEWPIKVVSIKALTRGTSEMQML